MSLLDRQFEQAAQQGIDVKAECDAQGMAFALLKADHLGLLIYKQGMAEDWLDSMHVFCYQNDRPPFTFMAVISAVLQLSVDAAKPFQTPREFWTAVSKWQRARLRAVLNGRQTPDLPDELQGAPLEREIAFKRAWLAAALQTGNEAETNRQARAAIGLPPEPAHIETGNYKTQIQGLIASMKRKSS